MNYSKKKSYLAGISKTVDIDTFFGKYNSCLIAVGDTSTADILTTADTSITADTSTTADTNKWSITNNVPWQSHCDWAWVYYSSRGRKPSSVDGQCSRWQRWRRCTNDTEFQQQLHTTAAAATASITTDVQSFICLHSNCSTQSLTVPTFVQVAHFSMAVTY